MPFNQVLNTLPMIQYTYCPVTTDGLLKCAVRDTIVGTSKTIVCGRNCIYIANKPWSICEHNVIKRESLK